MIGSVDNQSARERHQMFMSPRPEVYLLILCVGNSFSLSTRLMLVCSNVRAIKRSLNTQWVLSNVLDNDTAYHTSLIRKADWSQGQMLTNRLVSMALEEGSWQVAVSRQWSVL